MIKLTFKHTLLSILQSFMAKSIIEIPRTSSGQQAEYFYLKKPNKKSILIVANCLFDVLEYKFIHQKNSELRTEL
jgi:hypothetical protein